MSNLTKKYGKMQAGSGFYAVGKDMLKAFGVTKAVFIAVLADIDDYSILQGNERFFATLETLISKTRLNHLTIKKLLRELKSDGILSDGIKGEGLDNKKYYKIDYERLGEIVKNSLNKTTCDKYKNIPNDKYKNIPNDKYKNIPNDKYKNIPNERDKFTPNDKYKNIPNLPIDNIKDLQDQTLQDQIYKGESEKSLSAKSPELENEVSKPKSKFAKLSAKESIAYVTELYNQLEVKPKGDFETFCEWLKCKAGKKGLLEYVIKRDFECYQRLDLLTAESPNDRLNRALQGGKNGVYQSLKFDSDDFTGGGYRGVELKHNAKNVNDNFSVTQTQRDLFAKPKYSFSSDKIAKFDNRQKIADGGEKC